MGPREMLEEVQKLKEQVILNNFNKTVEVERFFNQYWMLILDMLDDALYEYLRG